MASLQFSSRPLSPQSLTLPIAILVEPQCQITPGEYVKKLGRYVG